MNDPAPLIDPLFELERKIARRADELSRHAGKEGLYPLASWLEAEWEIARDEFHGLGARISSPILPGRIAGVQWPQPDERVERPILG
jgi:hypothetical protein